VGVPGSARELRAVCGGGWADRHLRRVAGCQAACEPRAWRAARCKGCDAARLRNARRGGPWRHVTGLGASPGLRPNPNPCASRRTWHRNQDGAPVAADSVYVFRDLGRCANKRGAAAAPGPAQGPELAY